MFNYLKNRYNANPKLVQEDKLDSDKIYVKFIKAPYLIVPETVDAFRSTHKSKFWYNINRNIRLFEDSYGNLNFNIIKDEKRLDFFLDKVYCLFNERWKDEYTSSSWKCRDGFNEYKKALIDLSKSDEGFLAVLYDDSENLLSYGYCLNDKETVYFYQFTTSVDSNLRKFSLGKVLLFKLLTEIVAEGRFHVFDFMNGEQAYKSEWARKTKTIYFEVGKKDIFGYIKLVIYRVKFYLQFNSLFRNIFKTLLKYKK